MIKVLSKFYLDDHIKMYQANNDQYHDNDEDKTLTDVSEEVQGGDVLKRKFMTRSHCQEIGQLADQASDWLFNSCVSNQESARLLTQPFTMITANQDKSAWLLTQLLTMTTPHNFPSLVAGQKVGDGEHVLLLDLIQDKRT